MDAVYAWPLCNRVDLVTIQQCHFSQGGSDADVQNHILYAITRYVSFLCSSSFIPEAADAFLTAEISGDPLETPILQRDSETRFMRCLVGSTSSLVT